MTSCDYTSRADAELADWPGVTWSRGQTARHRYLALTYAGKTQRVIYPLSPSDWRGPRRHVTDIRHTLLAMGAKCTRKAHEAKQRRERDTAPPRNAVPQPVADDRRVGLADALAILRGA